MKIFLGFVILFSIAFWVSMWAFIIYPYQEYQTECVMAGFEGQSEPEVQGLVHCYTNENICTGTNCREVKHHYPLQVR